MLRIKLLSYTPDAERLIALAARLCYSPCSIEETGENFEDEKIKSFINMLVKIGHESPIEHISFTFGIEGVSRAFLSQITRHRIASYSVQSQRYVKENCFEYVTPPEIERSKEAKREFLLAMESAQNSYDKISSILATKHKAAFVKSGIEEGQALKLAEKRAIEDARFVLPNSCETKVICTFNARSLLNFFSQRCCNRAQWEIRSVAKEMLKLVCKVSPNIFKNAGPSCVRGSCSEGRMSCKEAEKVRNEFLALKGGAV